jgi:hypothetical protein
LIGDSAFGDRVVSHGRRELGVPTPDDDAATGPAIVREPIRKPWVWVGLGAIILAGIPWYLPAGMVEPVVIGLPAWTIVAVGSSVLLCGYLTWVLSRHWNLVEDYEEETGDCIGPDSAVDELGRRI